MCEAFGDMGGVGYSCNRFNKRREAMKDRLFKTIDRVIWVFEVAVYVTAILVIVSFLYLAGLKHGEMIGQGKGYEQCRMDTVFPTQSELDKVAEALR